MTQAERRTITDRVIFHSHPLSLLLSVGAVFAGLAASVIRGGVAMTPAFFTLLFAMFFQLAGNFYYGYRRVESLIDLNLAEKHDIDTIGYKILKVLSNAFAILAISVAFPLFAYIGWWSMLYMALTGGLIYFYFGGPYPLVKTRWSAVVTFLIFGPIAVSGTAMIQQPSLYDWSPIIAYSFMSGLLATNANLSLQFLRRQEDVKDGMTSLLAARGASLVRHLYLLNVGLVCCIMLLPLGAVGFGNGWFTILVVVFVLISGIIVYQMMRKDTMADGMKIRNLVIWQYDAVIILMLCMVLYSMDTYWLTFLAPRY